MARVAECGECSYLNFSTRVAVSVRFCMLKGTEQTRTRGDTPNWSN